MAPAETREYEVPAEGDYQAYADPEGEWVDPAPLDPNLPVQIAEHRDRAVIPFLPLGQPRPLNRFGFWRSLLFDLTRLASVRPRSDSR